MSNALSAHVRTATSQIYDGFERSLKKAVAHAKTKTLEDGVYLEWRLAPDMFPLKRQVEFATEMPARGLSRLAGAEIPSFENDSVSFDQLFARIERTRNIIDGLSDAALDKDPDGDIIVPMGPNEMTFKRAAFFQTFILPNLYFHVTAAYLILRNMGVDIGKRDFLAVPE